MPRLNGFLSRIQTDYSFYLEFRQSPQEALASYELSSEERAALTGSGAQLWAHLGRVMFTHTTSQGWVLPGGPEAEFTAATALSRPDIQRTVSQIRDAGTQTDRLAAVLRLIEHVG